MSQRGVPLFTSSLICQTGIVTRIAEQQAWVTTERQSTCGKCKARSSCGHGIMNANATVQIAVPLDEHMVKEGDEVELGIEPRELVSVSFAIYLVPLLALLATLWIGSWLALSEPVQILFSFAALAIGFYSVHRQQRPVEAMVRIVRVVSSVSTARHPSARTPRHPSA